MAENVIPMCPGQLELFYAEFGDQIEVRRSLDPNEDQIFITAFDSDMRVTANVKLDPDTAFKVGKTLIECSYSNISDMSTYLLEQMKA